MNSDSILLSDKSDLKHFKKCLNNVHGKCKKDTYKSI